MFPVNFYKNKMTEKFPMNLSSCLNDIWTAVKKKGLGVVQP